MNRFDVAITLAGVVCIIVGSVLTIGVGWGLLTVGSVGVLIGLFRG